MATSGDGRYNRKHLSSLLLILATHEVRLSEQDKIRPLFEHGIGSWSLDLCTSVYTFPKQALWKSAGSVILDGRRLGIGSDQNLLVFFQRVECSKGLKEGGSLRLLIQPRTHLRLPWISLFLERALCRRTLVPRWFDWSRARGRQGRSTRTSRTRRKYPQALSSSFVCHLSGSARPSLEALSGRSSRSRRRSCLSR